MNFFKKIFCGHKWKIHAKKEYKWQQEVKQELTSLTIEVLICETCGKIKKIKY